MINGRQVFGIISAALASAIFTIPADATCTYPPELPAQLKDGQPAHAADVIDYISACPNFTGPLRVVRSLGSSAAAYFEGNSALTGAPKIILRDSNGGSSDGILSFDKINGFNLTGGSVGIGTTSPSYALDVSGTVRATEFIPSSDRRLKTAIEPLDSDALARIIALRPVTFRWRTQKDDGMKGLQIGLIAQEVEKVLPSTVTTAHDTMKTKGIKYNELTAVLIKAVQEQQREIAALRAENIKLRQLHAEQIAGLSTRLDRLERTRLAKVQ